MSALICFFFFFSSTISLELIKFTCQLANFVQKFMGSFWNLKRIQTSVSGATWVWNNLMRLNAALSWQIDLKQKRSSEMNAFTSNTSFCPAIFFPLFPCSPSPFLCPVSLTGAAEGSQSVKEAHRGLMRTVLAKHVSRVRLCSTLMGVCTCIYSMCVSVW